MIFFLGSDSDCFSSFFRRKIIMAILSYKNHTFGSEGKSDNPKSCPFRKRVNEILKDVPPNNEFQNLSLDERRVSEDEGAGSSSDEEKCPHDCSMDVEYEDTLHALCGTLTEEFLVESLAENNNNTDQVQIFDK